jgi:hypothetical protein
LLTSKTAWSSDRCKMTWKVKVSKSNVSLYQLQASVLGINDSESGLWLTPSTMDISQRSPDAMKKRIEMRKKTGRTSIPPGSLSEQVQTGRPTKDMREVMDMETMKMYPTPRTGGGSRPNGKGGKVLEEEVMIEYGLRERGKTLKQMYPTPRASGQEDAETLIKRKGEKAAAQHNLTAHMQMFPNMKAVEEHLRSKKQSFPTPTSFDSNEITKPRKPHPGGGQKPPLNQIVQMYPTPSAQEAGEKIVGTLTSKDGSPLKPNERAYNPKTGKHVQMTLNRTVQNVSDTISELSVGCSSTTRDSEAELIRLECNEGWHWNQVRSEVERCSEQSKSTNRTWWQIESDLCGVPNGISRELDKDRASRIKSLGNAIVPQMARIFGLAIKKVLSDSDCNGQR